MRNIVIVFDELGGTTVEANGFKGKACEKELEKFISALGMETKRTKKKDFFLDDRIKQGN